MEIKYYLDQLIIPLFQALKTWIHSRYVSSTLRGYFGHNVIELSRKYFFFSIS
jgi:hypothetical protein